MNTITAWSFFTIDTEGRKEMMEYYQAKHTGMDRLEEISKRHGTTINQNAIGTQFWCSNAKNTQKWVMEIIKIN